MTNIKTFIEFIKENFTSPLLDSTPSRNIVFTKKSFNQFNDWVVIDRKKHKSISKLIEQTTRDPFTGSKAEPLHKSGGKWSKHIDEKNRLVYLVTDSEIKIVSCMGHYDDK